MPTSASGVPRMQPDTVDSPRRTGGPGLTRPRALRRRRPGEVAGRRHNRASTRPGGCTRVAVGAQWPRESPGANAVVGDDVLLRPGSHGDRGAQAGVADGNPKGRRAASARRSRGPGPRTDGPRLRRLYVMYAPHVALSTPDRASQRRRREVRERTRRRRDSARRRACTFTSSCPARLSRPASSCLPPGVIADRRTRDWRRPQLVLMRGRFFASDAFERGGLRIKSGPTVAEVDRPREVLVQNTRRRMTSAPLGVHSRTHGQAARSRGRTGA